MRNYLAIFAATMLLATPSFAQSIDRDLSSDRPGKASTPFTVPQDHFQVETDFLSYTQGYNGKSRMFQAADPTLKYGVTNNLDLEISIGGYINSWTKTGNSAKRNDGFGDTTVTAKYNIIGNDGGAYSIAVIPYMKIPTASTRIGNGRMEYGVSLPVSYNLPDKYVLTVQPALAILRNTSNNGTQMSYSGTVNLARPIYGELSGFVELYGNVNGDSHTKSNVSANTGLSYNVTKNISLDAGVNVGLNKFTPAFVTYTGLTVRY